MKKLFFVSAVLFAFCFASCKKEYTCVCKDGATTLATYTIKETKKKSKDVCKAFDVNWKIVYPAVSCTIQ